MYKTTIPNHVCKIGFLEIFCVLDVELYILYTVLYITCRRLFFVEFFDTPCCCRKSNLIQTIVSSK
jgi:hypothetical protein